MPPLGSSPSAAPSSLRSAVAPLVAGASPPVRVVMPRSPPKAQAQAQVQAQAPVGTTPRDIAMRSRHSSAAAPTARGAGGAVGDAVVRQGAIRAAGVGAGAGQWGHEEVHSAEGESHIGLFSISVGRLASSGGWSEERGSRGERDSSMPLSKSLSHGSGKGGQRCL